MSHINNNDIIDLVFPFLYANYKEKGLELSSYTNQNHADWWRYISILSIIEGEDIYRIEYKCEKKSRYV